MALSYQGGKARHANAILAVMAEVCSERLMPAPQTKLFAIGINEPFCGGAWFTTAARKRGYNVCAGDANGHVVSLWQEVSKGRTDWIPEHVSEDEYNAFKRVWKTHANSRLIGFIGAACSYGGKWFGGYARDQYRNYAAESRRSILKAAEHLRCVTFLHVPFEYWPASGTRVYYLDPPYDGAEGYQGTRFDSAAFWNRAEYLAESGPVFVSEYNAPDGWREVWRKAVKTSLNNQSGDKQPDRLEKLFVKGPGI
jgi:DNA adenine methylase